MRELAPLTCLVITLYDKPNAPACPHHEHGDLIDAIEAHVGAPAAACMLEHLEHIEATLNFEVVKDASPDIEAVFS